MTLQWTHHSHTDCSYTSSKANKSRLGAVGSSYSTIQGCAQQLATKKTARELLNQHQGTKSVCLEKGRKVSLELPKSLYVSFDRKGSHMILLWHNPQRKPALDDDKD